jgi:hypothetical protein
MKVSVFIIVNIASIAVACTGYAVYTDHAWYGMNFDYPPESEIRFTISDTDDFSVFTMDFFSNEGYYWIPTVGMNENGLFSSLQYQCPMVEGAAEPKAGQLYLHQLFNTAINECSALDEVESIIDSFELINLYDLTLHALIADSSGNALIAEAGDGENLITDMNGEWIVMTNFRNADFEGIPPEDIVGVGDSRYRNAMAYLTGHHNSFSLAEAMETLEAALNDDPVWGTKASMVFDPEGGCVYIGIDSDFERIWKLSFETQTIETWHGFLKKRSVHVDGEGLTAMEMRTWE